MSKKEYPPINVGQRYRDRDKRMPGRTVLVEELAGEHVWVRSEQTKRRTKISIRRLQSKEYELVEGSA